MKIQQNANVENLRYATLEQLQNDLERKGYTHQILHKTKGQVATGGGGATIELEESATETITDIGKTELTIVAACDTNDNAYDTKTITIHYLDADGVSHEAEATYDPDNTTTEVAFDPAVADFYCFDPAYGVLAIVSSVAVQSGDNVYIGTTGMVADATKRVATILAAATSPTAANILGVGAIYGSEAANQADEGYIATLEYVTPWGAIKTATWTFPADSSVATRFASVTDSGLKVSDFYRRRSFTLDHAALDECRVSNADKSAIYAAIDIGKSTETFTRHWVPRAAEIQRCWIGKLKALYPTLSEFCTITLTFTNEDGAADSYVKTIVGHEPIDEDLCIPVEPNTEIKAVVVDDAATGGTLDFELQILEIEA